MKKVVLLLIVSMVVGCVTGCMSYVRIPEGDDIIIENKEEDETTLKQIGNGSVDRARLGKDKTSVEELHHVISMVTFVDEYIELRSSGNSVVSDENGEIEVSKLFDTSTDVGKNAVEEINDIVGEEEYIIKFTSKFKTECALEIVELDVNNKNVVIQFVAKGYGIEFYVDADGTHEGVYKK